MDETQNPAGGNFRLKAREFERINEPGAAPEPPPTEGPTRDAGGGDVLEMLRANAEHDTARGWFRVKPGGGTKLRRRIVNYCALLVAVDAPLSYVAWSSGHADPFPFVFALAGIAYFTAQLTWEAWFLRTD
jgi:hypothetical protein